MVRVKKREQRAEQWNDGRRKDKKVGREKRWRERMMVRQHGWRRNGEGETDRERWLCVILRTTFIYTWNKRPALACKRLSWWRLKWNWHFQFVPWHVCLGLFTHSSASPTVAILLFHPLLFLLFSPSLYSIPLPLYKPPPPSISVGLSLSPASIPRNAHSQTRKYGADSFISYTKHVQRNTCAHFTINMHSALGQFPGDRCQQIHQRLMA